LPARRRATYQYELIPSSMLSCTASRRHTAFRKHEASTLTNNVRFHASTLIGPLLSHVIVWSASILLVPIRLGTHTRLRRMLRTVIIRKPRASGSEQGYSELFFRCDKQRDDKQRKENGNGALCHAYLDFPPVSEPG